MTTSTPTVPLLSTSDGGLEPLRFGSNTRVTGALNEGSHGSPHSRGDEKGFVREPVNLLEKQPRDKWAHEGLQNLARGRDGVRRPLTIRPCASPFLYLWVADPAFFVSPCVIVFGV